MKKGFTLAEMTMVTAIIGVITAICVTPVIGNAREKEFQALTKKAVTTLQDAIDYKLANYGWPADGSSISFLKWITRDDQYEKAVLSHTDNSSDYNYIKTNANISYYMLAGTYYYTADVCLRTPSQADTTSVCRVCMDINGDDPPTTGYNSSNWTTKLKPKYQDDAARDIVCAWVKEGIVTKPVCSDAGCTRYEQYFEKTE